jgi:hypothetical protein
LAFGKEGKGRVHTLIYLALCMSTIVCLTLRVCFSLLARKGMMTNWNVNVVITAELGSKDFVLGEKL